MNLDFLQGEAVEQFRRNGWRGIAFWKPGEGKTRIGLACAKLSPALAAVIVCPKRAMKGWEDEIKEVGFNMPYALISMDSIAKQSESIPIPHEECILIVDELYNFASGKSARAKVLRNFRNGFHWRIGLSGTLMPANNNESIYWQLFNLGLTRDVPTFESFTRYRSIYRRCGLSHFKVDGRNIPLWENAPGSKEKILKMVGHLVHVNFPDHAHRKIHHKVVRVGLSPRQKKAIQHTQKYFELELPTGEVKDLKTAMEVLAATNRISNGLLSPCRKIDELSNILQELEAAGEKVVVWCHYREDIERLQEIFPRSLRFWGGEQFDHVAWSSGKYPVVFATCASGSSVNYFKDVQYAIYFSLPLKLVDFLQSQGRHERKSSKHEGAYYYYLLNETPSFDGQIYDLLISNQDAENEIIKALTKE